MSSTWHGDVPSFPELYDLLHSANLDDIDMYRRLSKPHMVALECGIGTGRVAIPLARDGITVYGIDSSPEMIARLNDKLQDEPREVSQRVVARQADMTAFDLGTQFNICYIPFMTFNYLGSLAEQRACLRCIRRHLRSGGHMVMELMSYYAPWFLGDETCRCVARCALADGTRVEVWRSTAFDAPSQAMEHTRYYRFYDQSGSLTREQSVVLRNRFLFLGEATLLLEAEGFAVEEVWGNHAGGRYTAESQVMVLVCEPR